jgi:DNA-binding response OmpR family regulator
VRILIVEDDDRVARGLATALRRHGYDVLRAATAEDALAAVQPAGSVDLVLLDLGLPDADGLDVCRKLRKRDSVAVIAVTARSDERDRIVGLRSGADDYVVKPFGIGELLARIEAVTRRTRTARGAEDEPVVYEIGPLTVDTGARRAALRGQPLALTRKEFDLLAVLAARPNVVCTRDRLIDQVWQASWEAPSRTLDVHVAALRAKLTGDQDAVGGTGIAIETVRGVGYRLRA